ncbi:MAG: ABC transporter ATP-binding protein [Clostridia bacterium]|nr:ABC transporter ATP-binding protein [Clostridia bacterium]MEE0808483.1 ABC transporter ATP-binding protein [Acutalibacteraceae bacterium]
MRTIKLIKRFLPYYKKYVGTLCFDLFCAALTTVCELVLPMIVREITDLATTDAAALTVSFVLRIGAFYLVLRAIDTAANYYMATIGHIMGTKIETDMRRDMFSHLQRLSFSYYDNTKIGSIMSRITSDLFDVTEFAHHCPEEFFIAFVKITAAFVILCRVNVGLTLIIFSIVPPMVVVLMFFSHRMKDGFRESRKKVAELNSSVEDSLLGIRVVKSFANEDIEEEKFREGNVGFLKVKTKVYKYMGSFHSCIRLFDGLMYITVVVAGAIFIGKGKISAADLVAYLMFVTTLLTSIRRIVEFSEQFQRGMTGIERFAEIVDQNPDIVDKADAVELTDVKGDINFSDVSFAYSEENEEVLAHLNLRINAGENVALVGPSGGGKTTICSLIPRFYDIEKGKITVDGLDIRDVTLKSLRENIGIVQQDVYLFSGSVMENIAYGKPDATPDEVYAAARLAGAEEFIKNLPDGYNTYVGERGVKLSGGQKQRISIARVFLKNPPILILDEATSALDNESERLVQKSLEALAKGRTTLTIAHRLTTIKNADKIIVLTADGIVESGSHKELLSAGGLYSDLYKSYSET